MRVSYMIKLQLVFNQILHLNNPFSLLPYAFIPKCPNFNHLKPKHAYSIRFCLIMYSRSV